MQEMTPLEAAKKLESMACDASGIVPEKSGNKQLVDITLHVPSDIKVLRFAASYLRKIASGEYAPVVHGRWENPTISETNFKNPYYFCSNCGNAVRPKKQSKYCSFCGAVMDGKEQEVTK